MARILSQSLIGSLRTPIREQSAPVLLSSRLLNCRARSSGSDKAAPPPPADAADEVSPSAATEVEVIGVRRLEDALQSVIARRAAPDWLPFLPGSSYWVPPRRMRRGHVGVVKFLESINIAAAGKKNKEELLSLSSSRGWPSSTYFVDGVSLDLVEPSTSPDSVDSSSENPMTKIDVEEG